MSNRLAGKVALIAGGSMALAEADARLFKDEGATVIIADINCELGEKLMSATSM